jgi:adenylate cyclase
VEAAGPNRSRVIAHLLVSVLITATACLAFDRFLPLDRAETYLRNLRIESGRHAERHPDLVHVSVDKRNYSEAFTSEQIAGATPDDQYFMTLLQGEFPWTREVWGHVSDRLIQGGAKGVLLDFMFTSETEVDAEFRAVITKHSPKIVLGGMIQVEEDIIAASGPNQSLVAPDEFGDNLGRPAVGLLNTHKEADGVVRRGMYDVDFSRVIAEARPELAESMPADQGLILHGLASRALTLCGKGNLIPAPMRKPMIRFAGPAGTFEPISLSRVVDPVKWKSEFLDTAFFENRLVVIGPGPAVLDNESQTPFGPMSGTEIHLNVINAGLQGEFISETERSTNLGLIIGSGVLAFVLGLVCHRRWLRGSIGLAVGCVFCGFVFWLYSSRNLMVSTLLTPLILSFFSIGSSFIKDAAVVSEKRGESRED